MNSECGSAEWLKLNAWFTCGYCEAADEPTVHRAADLRAWKGKTVCDNCWSNSGFDEDSPDDDFPDVWTYLDKFEPFACLGVEVPDAG